jgi:hypothetical protein
MPGKPAQNLSKILSGKYGREISIANVMHRVKYLCK